MGTKLSIKIFFIFFSKSSTPSEQEKIFLSVVTQKMPEIWPFEVWRNSLFTRTVQHRDAQKDQS